MSVSEESRRPLKSRSRRWAVWASSALAKGGATPNGISAISVVFAFAGGLAFVAAGYGWINWHVGWLVGAVCVQARLVCNLLDGMVAIEGGKKSATGGIWNEAPDRFADAFLLFGAGIGCGQPWLGVGCAWAAAMTAYVRALGATLTGKQDFCGPMAKPQRMAVLTFQAVAFGIFVNASRAVDAGFWILGVIFVGTLFTIFRRLYRLAQQLKSQQS